MAGLNARIGKAAATGLLAGAMGGLALLAGGVLAAKARRYAKPTMGLALRTSMGKLSAPTLRLVLLGDSAAIGVGVEWLSETVGGQLARLLAEGGADTGERHVLLSSVGVAGSRSADLAWVSASASSPSTSASQPAASTAATVPRAPGCASAAARKRRASSGSSTTQVRARPDNAGTSTWALPVAATVSTASR